MNNYRARVRKALVGYVAHCYHGTLETYVVSKHWRPNREAALWSAQRKAERLRRRDLRLNSWEHS